MKRVALAAVALALLVGSPAASGREAAELRDLVVAFHRSCAA